MYMYTQVLFLDVMHIMTEKSNNL